MGVSRTLWRTGAAPISRAVGRRETRTRHSVRHNGETCECHLPVPLYPTLQLKQIIRRVSLCRPSPACCLLYYTILPCPALSSVPAPTHKRTCTHTYLGLRGFWQRACWTHTHHFEPDKSPPFQSLKCLGCCSFTSTAAALGCTARHWLHCTGTTGLDWTGWRRWAWLPSERASKAVELLRCAPGLPVHLSPLHSVHCPLSNFYSLGPPVNSNPPFHPSSPD